MVAPCATWHDLIRVPLHGAPHCYTTQHKNFYYQVLTANHGDFIHHCSPPYDGPLPFDRLGFLSHAYIYFCLKSDSDTIC